MRVPVTGVLYSVIDHSGQKVATQIVPIPDAVLKVPGRNSPAKNELVFEAENLAPLGYQSFYIFEDESDRKTTVGENFDGKV